MTKILTPKEAVQMSANLRQKNKKIVICGGCFDILHLGHIRFLKQAKKQGDVLLLLLESDESVRKLKGPKRPINSQRDRAEILSSLTDVDYVVLLKNMQSNSDYDNLIFKIKPSVFAITKAGKQEKHVKRQAVRVNAKVIPVVNRLKDKSTSRLAKIIFEKFKE